MATVIDDRVQETTATTGTGTFTLAGAKTGFQSFANIGDGNDTYYCCTDGTDYEVGIGTYTASGTTLTRTTILDSTNGGSAVNWSAGSRDIFCTMPAGKVVFEDSSNNVAVAGTVDGRDLATDGTKLDGIEANATADQTGAEIKTAYEGEADTNAFTDALLTKLNGIETAADVTDATNVAAAGALIAGSSSGVQFGSFGVGTAASGTTGEIRATNNVTAYYSDERLKNFHGPIEDALDKIKQVNGYYFTENEEAKSLGYNNPEMQVGVSAQEIKKVLPEAVTAAPINDKYLTVYYEKLVPLLIQAIKELEDKVNALTK
jgi:hypothetical protein